MVLRVTVECYYCYLSWIVWMKEDGEIMTTISQCGNGGYWSDGSSFCFWSWPPLLECNCGITPPEVAGNKRRKGLVDTRQPPLPFFFFLGLFFRHFCKILAPLKTSEANNKKRSRWRRRSQWGSGQQPPQPIRKEFRTWMMFSCWILFIAGFILSRATQSKSEEEDRKCPDGI